MKKIFLLIVGLSILVSTNANHNPFNKSEKRLKEKQEKIKNNSIVLPKTLANVNVPTLIKESTWDISGSSWTGEAATKNIYANDLLVTDYQMYYDLTDTLFRSQYTYNTDKQLVEMIRTYKQAPGVFTNSFRYTLTYFNNGLGRKITSESWDEFTQTWNPQIRQTEEFNSRGAYVQFIAESFVNGAWEISFGYKTKITYLNSTSDKTLEQIDSAYFSQTMKFEVDYGETTTYNSNGEVLSMNFYSAPGLSMPLELTGIDSIFYSNNKPSRLISYVNDMNVLTYDYKVEDIVWYIYDINKYIYDNLVSSFVESDWNGTAWEYSNRGNNTYPDNYGSTIGTEEIYEVNNWVFSTRYKSLYDSKFNGIEYSEEEYDSNLSTWNLLYGDKRTIQYDSNGNMTEDIYSSVEQGIGTWVNAAKIEYFDYISINTGINTSKKTIETKLYPNPSNTGEVSINVKMEQASDLNIKIIDLKGSIVSTQTENISKGLNTLQLKGLERGMYIVELSTSFGISRTKLVVN